MLSVPKKYDEEKRKKVKSLYLCFLHTNLFQIWEPWHGSLIQPKEMIDLLHRLRLLNRKVNFADYSISNSDGPNFKFQISLHEMRLQILKM